MSDLSLKSSNLGLKADTLLRLVVSLFLKSLDYCLGAVQTLPQDLNLVLLLSIVVIKSCNHIVVILSLSNQICVHCFKISLFYLEHMVELWRDDLWRGRLTWIHHQINSVRVLDLNQIKFKF